MAGQTNYREVEVAATLITRGQEILAVYNEQWMAFTLPMTKRRTWDDPNIPVAHREEAWIDAAARAAAEWLGRTVTGLTELPLPPDTEPYHQSDRTGQWTRYTFQVFRLELDPNDEPLPGAVTQWLTREQLLDESRRPISPTLRHVLQALDQAGHFA